MGLAALHLPAPQPYQPENFVLRLSIKLFNCTPAELPADLRDQLTDWLKGAPAGMTTICLFLTLGCRDIDA